MTDELRQEALSRAYIQAVISGAGMSFSVPSADYGVDLTVHEITTRTDPRTGKTRIVEAGRSLDVQLKSTTRAVVDDDNVAYDLDVKTYDDLRMEDVITPRILVVYALPRTDSKDFLHLAQDHEGLLIRGCCYWVSLRGRKGATQTHTIRVQLPKKNVFSPVELKRLMSLIPDGRKP